MTKISKSLIYSLLAGVLMGASWPTYGFPFLMFVAWVPLLLMEHEISINKNLKKKSGKIFGYSYLSFFIFNITAIHWLWLVEENKFGAFVPTVVLNALLMAFFFMIYHWFKQKLGTVWGLICLPFIWIIFEKMHLSWELNWPWLNLGNVFADYHQWIQWYSITGTLGGTLWLLTVNIILFYFYKVYLVTRQKKQWQKGLLISMLIFTIPSIFSWYSYNNLDDIGEEVEVMMLQPDVDPYIEKYSRTSNDLVAQLAQQMGGMSDKTQLIIAPETAFPGRGAISFETMEQDPLINLLRNNITAPNAVLVSGSEVIEKVSGPGKDVNFDPPSGIYFKAYNVALQIEKGDSTQMYIKSKLVPMVEYFSYRNLLKPILGSAMLDFGGSTNTLARPSQPAVFSNDKNNIKVAPTVCYESVFGEYTSEFVKKGANLISISTNDSWWQDSQGHKQLLAYAKLRAIENRRYIVRSANSGISAVINASGDITAQLPYLYEGTLTDYAKLREEKTYYTENGDYLARIAFLIMGIMLGYLIALYLKKFIK